MISRHTSLVDNIVAFCRHLRANGFAIGPEEQATALRAAALLSPNNRATFALALQVSLTRTEQEVEQFGRHFETYWQELEQAVDSKIKDDATKKSKQNGSTQPSFDTLKSWLSGNKNTQEIETATYSAAETLSQQDFSLIPSDQLKELEQLLREIAQILSRRLSRRQERAFHRRTFDLRRTLRHNLRRGGEMMELHYKRPRRNRTKLVILADVSKSMDLYSAFLIQFMYAFQRVFRRMETFVFSTDLHRITSDLNQQNYQEALQKLSVKPSGWSGGTRIGASFQTFVADYGRLLTKDTLVVILSDGWDTDQGEALADAMQQIHQKSRKVIWLNPLAGRPGYKPRTAAMQAALPAIDVFASAHNAASLRALGKWL